MIKRLASSFIIIFTSLALYAYDKDQLIEVSDLIVAEAMDEDSRSKIIAVGEGIKEVAEYAAWLNTLSIDKKREKTISALDGLYAYAIATFGSHTPVTISLRLNVLIEESKIFRVDDKFNQIVEDSYKMLSENKSNFARSVNLLARMMRFRYYHNFNNDFSPDNYFELIDFEKEALELFPPQSSDVSRIRIEIYSCLADIISYPINHVKERTLALRIAKKDDYIEDKALTLSYLVGQDKDYWSNALWYYEKAQEMAEILYPKGDIRLEVAKYLRIIDAINTLGYSEELLTELNQSSSFFENYYPMSSPSYISMRINKWLIDIVLGNQPTGFDSIEIIIDNLRKNFGEESEYFAQTFGQIAILGMHLNSDPQKYSDSLSSISNYVYGKDSAKALSLQFSSYRFLFVANPVSYFELIDMIGDKFLENMLNDEEWLELGINLTNFYRYEANRYDKAFQISWKISEIVSSLRGEYSPYYCLQLLNSAVLASVTDANNEVKEERISNEIYNLFFKTLDNIDTDKGIKDDLELSGLYHRAHHLLFLEEDFEKALDVIEKILSVVKDKYDSPGDEFISMKSLALLSLGKNDSMTDKEVGDIIANLASLEPYSRNLETIQNCAEYLIKANKPEDALTAIELGLEANEAVGRGFSEIYIKLRSLSVEAYTMLKDFNRVRRIVSEDIVSIDNFNYINNSTELLNYLWLCFDIAKADQANFMECMTYLNEIQRISFLMIQTSGLRDIFLINHILPAYTQMLEIVANETLPNQIDLKDLPINSQEYELYSLYLSRFPELLESLDSVNENLISVLAEFDKTKYISVFIPFLNSYANYLNNVRHDSLKAEYYFMESLKLAQSADDNNWIGVLASHLYPFYYHSGDQAKGMYYLKIFENRVLSDTDPRLRDCLNIDSYYVRSYIETMDYEKAIPYSRDAFDRIKEELEGSYQLMTTEDQNNFMNSIGDPAALLSSMVEFCPDILAAETYDAILYRTGLQLRSQQDTRKAILNGSDEIVQLNSNLQILRDKLARIEPRYERDEMLGSKLTNISEVQKLRREINRIEQILIDETASSRNSVTKSADWKSIRNSLHQNEAAVEFVYSFNRLVALIIKQDSEMPLAVPLCNTSELVNALDHLSDKYNIENTVKALYGDSESPLYSLLWAPMEYLMDGVNRIYLSSPGILSSISFDAIVKPDGSRLFDDFEIYRLTSTAQLLDINDGEMPEDALILGNVFYSDLQRELYAEESDSNYNPVAEQKRVAERENFGYLRFAAREVAEIHNSLSRIKTVLLSGDDASELNLRKNIAQNSPGILHIATHGYFFADESAAYEIPFMMKRRQNIGSSMHRAGLALDNAEMTWQGEDLPSEEDGILTADEISQLNLNGTSLVTLSACQTALGNYSFEGVYGLQRGLKIAGAKTMLLSLWNVEDIASSKFMTYFYQKWFESNDCRVAYRESVKELRKTHPNAYYWAAFVMID